MVSSTREAGIRKGFREAVVGKEGQPFCLGAGSSRGECGSGVCEVGKRES